MKPTYPCNDIARSYLERYESILAEMIRGMTQAELTDSISHDFIVRMIPHHRAAIEMSENLLRYTTNLPLQRIARRIIREQTQSIAQLEQALPLCGQPAGPQALRDYRRRAEQIQTRMFRAMENARRDNRLNCDFMSEMIPHHRARWSCPATPCGFLCARSYCPFWKRSSAPRRGASIRCRRWHDS